jgi:STE24 endopeptidase
MGLVSRFRYVLLSDALLEQMSERDIAAVFAHEAQHVKGMHIFYSMLFAISSSTLCAWSAERVRAAAGLGDWEAQVLAIMLLVAAWAFGFGWLSRRFERQSDVNGAWLIGRMEQPEAPADIITPAGAEAFAHALQSIAQLNGISLTHRNWRHGSLEGRISYVLWLGSTFASRRKIDRLVLWMKVALWLATAISVALLLWG